MSRKNILVFPCGSEIALEIHRAVGKSVHFNLIGASSVDDHGKFVYKNYIGGIPFATDDSFIPKIKEVVEGHDIDAIYPAMDAVIEVLKRNEDDIGCKVIASKAETTRICLSKTRTYQRLKGIVDTPAVYDSMAAVEEFPVFTKPDIGYGSRGARKCRSMEELAVQLGHYPSSIICEYLPGEEYTVDCFTDRDGKLLACCPRTRSRIMNGISVGTREVQDTRVFCQIAQRINRTLDFSGAWFFQVKRNAGGGLVLLEVASRFAGSSSLFRAKGLNFALMSLYNAFGIPVSIVRNDYSVEMDRALDNKYRIDIEYDEVFVDFDDCLLLDQKYINEQLVAFLFRCRNHGIRLSLLTKHDDNALVPLQKLLYDLRIGVLFDRIIHIGADDQKCRYIDNRNAIFIDDSFAERRAVRESCGIHVFSVDMVEAL